MKAKKIIKGILGLGVVSGVAYLASSALQYFKKVHL